MRIAYILALSLAAWVAGSGASEARQVLAFLPEEMEPQATLVCNGVVLSVEPTQPRQILHDAVFGPEVVMVAKIKILHVFKGEAPPQIEFHYHIWDLPAPDRYMAWLPDHVDLKVGARYRFFLKPSDTPGTYVGVLDAKEDDAYDVEKLYATDPDDKSFLKKAEAIRIAWDYLRAKDVGVACDWTRTTVEYNIDGPLGAEWNVCLFKMSGSTSSAANIAVLDNGTVNVPDTRLNN